MPFKEIIEELHWKQKISVSELSRQCGMTREGIGQIAKRLSLPVRSHRESVKLTKNKGDKHWAYGLRKETDDRIKDHSDRMIKRNPAKNPEIRAKMSKSLSKVFTKNPLEQEIAFKEFLELLNVKYKEQFPISSFVIDFFVPKLNLCIEIDSTHHWGHHRRFKAKEKDEYLNAKGFKVLRIDKTWALEFSRITEILLTNKLICKK